MIIPSQLLHQIADATLPKAERAQLRCQLAKQLEEIGNYDAAREAMGELWPQVGERPVLHELDESTAGEVLLRVGVLTGWLGSVKQIEGAHEAAKNLISESVTIFETLGDRRKIAESQMELGPCYWREGAFDDARVWLKEALNRVPDDARELKAIILSRLATVERAAKRFNDAYQLLTVAAPLVNTSDNNSLRGKFHNQFATVLENIGRAENTKDYIDRALIEYAAASYYFEQAGHRRYQACVENNLGYLFCTIKKFPDAHHHLDRAQALFTSMKDNVHIAQVDDTRAKVLLAEGRVADAEKLVRSAVQILERGGEQSLLAEALTTHGLVLARLGRHKVARSTLQRALEAAQNAGDSEAAGLAALTILEELAEHLPAQDLSDTFERAAELLSCTQHPATKDRLVSCARRVVHLAGVLPTPPTWKGFNLYEAVRRFEARVIERALRDAGGVVARAAQLLGINRQSLDTMLHVGRHKDLAHLRAPVEPRRSSLMFRDEVDCPDTRAVTVLHVEDDALVAEGVRMSLTGEGWSVETCGDGAGALERLRSAGRYDVLIFDNNLPDTDGVELIRRTRALAHRQQTPIIVLSADDVEAQARRAGANSFLQKPAGVASVVETVARLLARKKGSEG
jgi:two-component system chemotaxis response regulator CheY